MFLQPLLCTLVNDVSIMYHLGTFTSFLKYISIMNDQYTNGFSLEHK